MSSSSSPPQPPPSSTTSSPLAPTSLPNPNPLKSIPPAMPAPNPSSPAPDPVPLYALRAWLSQAVVASFIAGGVAGAVSRTVVSPLERLKILLQVQNVGRDEYKMSISKALGKMWREEGWRGMMAGNGTNCIRIVPYSAVQFGSYNIYKKGFEDTPGAPLPPLYRLVCGAMAGITSVTVTYPLDIVRTRLSIQSASFAALAKQDAAVAAASTSPATSAAKTTIPPQASQASQAAASATNMSAKATQEAIKKKLPGMGETMKHMYTNEGGFVALYRGIVPTVAGVAPYVGLNFMIYESVRAYFTPEGESNPGPFGKLGAGAISGGVAQTCTYPLDVLRRRFQINTMSGMGYQYKSIFDAVRVIVAQEGVKGLYKGISPNLLKVAPSMASSWLSFEMTRDWIMSYDPKEVDEV